MLRITVVERGLQRVRKGLENLRAEIPKVAKTRLRAVSEDIVRRMQKYPGLRPKQRYTRTYLFQRSWVIKDTASGYNITNNAKRKGVPYPEFVVGTITNPSRQAWMHSGRWQLFADVVGYVVERLPKAVREHLQTAVRKAFA